MKKVLIIFIIIVASITTFAQNQKIIDSLKNTINKTNQDTIIICTYLNLSREYKNINTDTALSYTNLALNKSLKINYKKGIAEAYRQEGEIMIHNNDYKTADSLLLIAIAIYREMNYQIGIMKCYICFSEYAYYKGENHLMLEYCMKAFKIAEKNNFIEYKSTIFNNIAVAFAKMGNYDKATKYLFYALEISEKLGDKETIAKCNTNLGCIFIQIEELDKALEYLHKALKLSVELKDTRKQSTCLTNIGDVNKEQKKYNEAIQNYYKALVLDKENNDLNGVLINYSNIGITYYELKKYNTAKIYYYKSLEISEIVGNNSRIATCYYNIAKVEIKLKDYNIAEAYCLKSTEFFKKNNELYNLQESLQLLSSIYKLQNRYKKAYNTHIEAVAIKDSVFNIEKAKKIAQLEEKYLNEKKDKQIQSLKCENNIKTIKINHHKKIYIIFIIVLILTGVVVTIILIQYKKKNNAYRFLVSKNLDVLSKEKELKNFKEKTKSCDMCPQNIVSDNEKEKILEKLENLLETDKIFTQYNLTISKLAKKLSTNRNYLSGVINNEYRKNYNDFINEYRVKEAMLLLSDKKNKKFTVEAVAKEAGFSSVSTFNPVFKKYTGLTPTKFIKRLDL